MSIKGITQIMYVGGEEARIITLLGKSIPVIYSDLERLDYMLAVNSESGYVDFIHNDSKNIRFEFSAKSNGKILKTIKSIHNNYPEITLLEKHPGDLKFYKRWWFTTRNGRNLVTTFLLICGIIGTRTAYTHYSSVVHDDTNIYDSAQGSVIKDSYVSNSSSEDMPLSEKTDAFSTTLITGHYLIGTDLPVGTYDFYSKKGTGNLITSDGSVNVIFDHNKKSSKNIGIDNFGTEELNNIYLAEGIILTVTGGQEVSAGCEDGMVNSMKERGQQGIEEIEIGYGQYGASDNIPAGTYDIEWVEGTGNIICSSSLDTGINEIMGEASDDSAIKESIIKKFKNLTLNEGDILEVNEIKVKLIPSK